MEQKKEVASIEDLDYSSKDCQLLIREYKKIISKMTKEYDDLVAENIELRNRLGIMEAMLMDKSNTNVPPDTDNIQLTNIDIKKDDGTNEYSLFEAFLISLKINGIKATLKKVYRKLFKNN